MKHYFFGNWKSYLSIAEGNELADQLAQLDIDSSVLEISIFPSSSSLDSISSILGDSDITVGCQNIYAKLNGAFTGSTTINILKELGIKYCLVGHSEVRVYMAETDEQVNKKVLALLKHDITPVICIGETKDQRDAGESESVIKNQLSIGLKGIDPKDVIIAYEPIWAIKGFGAKESATNSQITKMHEYIRNLCNNDDTAILYGGSVDESSVVELLKLDVVNGFLVGSASTEWGRCSKIIEAMK